MNINTLKLFEICARHKIAFLYKTEGNGKNDIIIDVKKGRGIENNITIYIIDPTDENIPIMVNEKIKELENIFH